MDVSPKSTNNKYKYYVTNRVVDDYIAIKRAFLYSYSCFADFIISRIYGTYPINP